MSSAIGGFGEYSTPMPRIALAIALSLLAGAAQAASPTDQAVDMLCGKQIAVLGELPSHGEARAFAGKAGITRKLVERCGFDAVLFEAPIYEFIALEPAWRAQRGSARELDNAIGKFWWAKELASWRAWLLAEANAGRLRLGGIDDQVSATSERARATLPKLVDGACREVVVRHLEWTYDDVHPFDAAEKRALGNCAHVARTEAGDAAWLLSNFATLVDRQIEAKAAVDRDAVMYRNVQAYLQRWPRARLGVWTANVHAARASGGLPARPMGAWLADAHGDALGVVGFTALSGSSSMAGRPPRPLPPLGAASLEATALDGADDGVFVDASALGRLGRLESRLYGTPSTQAWNERFDAVIVLREEVPPTFVAPAKP